MKVNLALIFPTNLGFNLGFMHLMQMKVNAMQFPAYLQFHYQLLSCWSGYYDVASAGVYKSLFHSFVNKWEQGIVVSINIQQSHLQNVEIECIISSMNAPMVKQNLLQTLSKHSTTRYQKRKHDSYRFVVNSKLSPGYHFK